MPLDLHLNDVLVLKKPHPCGENRWRIYRLGADIGLKCDACGRLVMIPRSKLERRIRRIDRDGVVFKPADLPPMQLLAAPPRPDEQE